MSRIPLRYHTNVLFYTKYTHPTLIGRGIDAHMHARTDRWTDGRTENIYSIFRDKLLLLGEHVLKQETINAYFFVIVKRENSCKNFYLAMWILIQYVIRN